MGQAGLSISSMGQKSQPCLIADLRLVLGQIATEHKGDISCENNALFNAAWSSS